MAFRYRPGMRTIAITLTAVCLGLAACAGTPNSSPLPSAGLPHQSATPPATQSEASRPSVEASPTAALSSDPLHSIVLHDVRSGVEFTLGQLAAEHPVLLETMAIWCTNCRSQQHQVADAHGLADFDSVSLDVDPNERPGDLADYADREGFDWYFAVADADLAQMLRDRFGSAVLNPPSMPKILFRTDGSVELIGLGEQVGASDLVALVAG